MNKANDVSQRSVPVLRDENPFRGLQTGVNRLFSEFFDDLALPSWDRFTGAPFDLRPAIDIAESDKSYVVTTELPGLDARDVTIGVSDGYLTVKGEKKQESEQHGQDFVRQERTYGQFQRTIALPKDCDQDRIEAKMQKGVLTISVARAPAPESRERKIDIREVA